MDFLTRIISLLNIPANAFGEFAFAPMTSLPGWLSNTIISAAAGVLLMFIFKYTSNQRAIARIRDSIKADMLTLKLFKDSLAVTLEAQGRVFVSAFLLLFHSLIPMLVMIVPVSLLLAQMGLWYEFRPLKQAEQVVVVMKLNEQAEISQT